MGHRGEQMALLAGLVHERATDPRLGDLLERVESSELTGDPESAEAVNVRELRRDYDRETRLPRKLVEEMARVSAQSSQAWSRHATATTSDRSHRGSIALSSLVERSRRLRLRKRQVRRAARRLRTRHDE